MNLHRKSILPRAFQACSLLALSWAMVSCSGNFRQECLEPGVSRELAEFRRENITDLHYRLSFSLPSGLEEEVKAMAAITCRTDDPRAFILDFKAGEQAVDSVFLNGDRAVYDYRDEHIVLPGLVAGKNEVEVYFTSPDQSLNRRENFLYTLLVPDRARTLFPCMDQPDLKARYLLSLEIPQGWKAVANGKLSAEQNLPGTERVRMDFEETLPISTYLFSFAAGEMYKETFSRSGREISVYHRETDPAKAAQCPDMAAEVFDALEWMEEYTGIPYPFSKYDFVIVPGFQFGGMEHVGATLYTDRRMFLDPQPTLNERMIRSSLIAHETTHMWFGDDVTMRWFDDVWTKEVFANYFASLMVEPRFPEVNHRLDFMTGYFPGAYAEDRTSGSNAIKQDLGNLQDAGLVYGNIVYDKSPIVMGMLADKLGAEGFRAGMQRYLKTFAYGNATWDDLIGILDEFTPDDLKSWSHCWVNEKGRPEIRARMVEGCLLVSQEDPWGRGLVWPQEVSYCLIGKDGHEVVHADFSGGQAQVSVPLNRVWPTEETVVLPNVDGKAYGLFVLEEEQQAKIWPLLAKAAGKEFQSAAEGADVEVFRGASLINLFENLCSGFVEPASFSEGVASYLPSEPNPLLYNLGLKFYGKCQKCYMDDHRGAEVFLWEQVLHHPEAAARLQAFRQFRALADSPEALAELGKIWESGRMPVDNTLSEGDFMQLAYTLALHLPDRAEEILRRQASRISQPDRQQEFAFVSGAVLPSPEQRDSVFRALLLAENRTVEPWASEALAWLNHPCRGTEAVRYIRPALEVLQEIQRTGDIFFPSDWVESLLNGHRSAEAAQEVEDFFRDHPDYPEMLGNKIRQQLR